MNDPRSAPPDLPGFTLVRGIGAGGFADVFLYTQHQPHREVAVKVLRAEHLSASSLRQFAIEADVMAQVSHHPSIVTIHTAGVAPDGRPYIVMEHYPKPHFGIRSRDGDLPVAEVLRVGVQVASAVETAHRAGILHRDIKPANILTSGYDRPGLTDFGISAGGSRSTSPAAGPPYTPTRLTLAYSSPEVFLEDEGGDTELSDVYSLCATIYSLLSGHSPSWVPGADNSDHAVLHRVANGSITPLTRRDVPAELVFLLHNGLDPLPEVRPPSALALARALQRIERDLSLPPTPLEIRDDLAEAAAPTRPRLESPAPGDTPIRADTPIARAKLPPPPPPKGGGTVMSSARPFLAPLLMVLAIVLVGAGLVVLLSSGPDDQATGSTPTTVAGAPSTAPDGTATSTTSEGSGTDVVRAITIAAPTDLQLTLETTGRLTVSFTPSATNAGAALRYRLMREDEGRPWPGTDRTFTDVPGSPAVIEGLGPDERPCVTIIAVLDPGAQTSVPSELVCAAPQA